MKRVLILTLVGILPILSSQTLFKNTYLLSQNMVNAPRFASSGIPTDSLVAYYPFNGNANDESGNGYNGTVSGATLTTDRDGNSNSAYEFGGTSKYITLPFNFNGFTQYSVSLWVLAETGGVYPGIFCGGTTFTNRRPFIFINPDGDDNFEHNLRLDATTYQLMGNNISLRSVWKHVVCIWDGSFLYLYVDNASNATPISATGALVSSGVMYLGKDVSNNIYLGTGSKIDDIRVYKRALTTDEITLLYNE